MLPCFDVDVVVAHQTSSLITEGAIMQYLKTGKKMNRVSSVFAMTSIASVLKGISSKLFAQ